MSEIPETPQPLAVPSEVIAACKKRDAAFGAWRDALSAMMDPNYCGNPDRAMLARGLYQKAQREVEAIMHGSAPIIPRWAREHQEAENRALSERMDRLYLHNIDRAKIDPLLAERDAAFADYLVFVNLGPRIPGIETAKARYDAAQAALDKIFPRPAPPVSMKRAVDMALRRPIDIPQGKLPKKLRGLTADHVLTADVGTPRMNPALRIALALGGFAFGASATWMTWAWLDSYD